jgi:phenylacetate-CoA ligase
MIYEVAKHLNNLSIKTNNILMVKGTSEMILDAYQPEIEKAFGRRMISEYGAAEAGLIAFECPDGNMHINIESVYVEVDDNKEILITNLFSHSFPIIRYRLGDVVTITDEKCTCGRNHPILKEVIGRKGANIVGKNHSYPALTFYYVFKNIYLEHGVLLNYKAIQEIKGEVILYIEGKINSKFENLITHELNSYFSDDIVCGLKYVDEFEVQLKKRQYFESKL